MKLLIELKEGLDYPVKLEQKANKLFRVTYGKQVKDGLNYMKAAEEFGLCVFHSLSCAGTLDNTGD